VTPWIRTETTLFEVGADGNLNRTVVHQVCNSSPRTSLLPETLPFLPDPIVTLWEGCEASAMPFTDLGSGHNLLFNFAGKSLTFLALKKTAPGHYRVSGFYRPQI